MKTAHLLNEMGTDGVKIHDLHVLRSTVLEDWHEWRGDRRFERSTPRFTGHLPETSGTEDRRAQLICETPRSRRIAPRFPIPKQQIIARLSALLEEGDMFKEICFDDVQAGKNYSSNRYRPDDNRGMLYRVFLLPIGQVEYPSGGCLSETRTALPRVCRLRIFLLSAFFRAPEEETAKRREGSVVHFSTWASKAILRTLVSGTLVGGHH